MHPPQPTGPREHVLSQNPHGDRQQRAEQEEPQQGVIQRARREEAARHDGAPYHARVEVRAREGAGEAVGRQVRADVRDVGQGPVDDGDLRQGADEDADGLDEEELAGRDLSTCQMGLGEKDLGCVETYVAVDAELEVLRKSQPLDAGNVPQVEEPDIRQDLALVHVAGDDAAQHLGLDLNVCRGKDPRELHFMSEIPLQGVATRTGRKKMALMAKENSAPCHRSCTG